MKRLAPLSTQVSPWRSARVCSAPGSEPTSGSESAKEPSVSPDSSPGRTRCFCSSLPASRIGSDTSFT